MPFPPQWRKAEAERDPDLVRIEQERRQSQFALDALLKRIKEEGERILAARADATRSVKDGGPAQASVAPAVTLRPPPPPEQAVATPPPLPATSPAGFCGECGTPHEPGSSFCGSCGSPLDTAPPHLTAAPSPSNVCSACGAQHEPDSHFCGHCGVRFSK